MTDFAKMDIFFLISSAATVIITVLLAVLLIYLIAFVRNVKYISKKARMEADNIVEDIHELRKKVHAEGLKIINFTNFFKNIFKKGKKHGNEK